MNIYDKALQLLDQDGWTVGMMRDERGGRCALALLYEAMGLPGYAHNSMPDNNILQFFAKINDLASKQPFYCHCQQCNCCNLATPHLIYRWNDKLNSPEPLVEALRKASQAWNEQYDIIPEPEKELVSV